jgi:hypothetical protein
VAPHPALAARHVAKATSTLKRLLAFLVSEQFLGDRPLVAAWLLGGLGLVALTHWYGVAGVLIATAALVSCVRELRELLTWWMERRQRREHQGLEDRILLELQRAAYLSRGVPAYVSGALLAQRVGVTPDNLQPLLDRLAEERRIFPGLTPGTYGVREWPLDGSAD